MIDSIDKYDLFECICGEGRQSFNLYGTRSRLSHMHIGVIGRLKSYYTLVYHSIYKVYGKRKNNRQKK